MRNVLFLTAALGLALAACSGGKDCVADGTPRYDGTVTKGFTCYSANVQPGQEYVSGFGGGRVELKR